nr:reverse transcriptase domain-containing protein [Tanacetum cinerariifolium]
MVAPVISISSDLSDESVRSSISRVILIGSISVEVLVAPEVGEAAVASPAEVRELDTHSSSKADPSKSSLPYIFVAPMVLLFLCSDDSKSYTEMPERRVSPTPHDAMLARQDIPIGQLYRTHPGGPCRALTARKSVRPLPSHRLALRSASFSTMYPPTTSESSAGDSSSESSFEPSRKRCRSSATTMPSSIPALGALVPFCADLLPPLKRFRDSILPKDNVYEDIDADVLANIEAHVTAIEVAADMDVDARVDAGIGMEVDVGVDVEDEVEGDVESTDRGTMKVGVDVNDGIDIPDGMLMLDAMERLEQVEEVVQDNYGHVIDIPLQRVEDIKTGQRELKARSLISSRERAGFLDRVASLERSNARLRGTLRMVSTRVDRLQRRIRFMAGELRKIRRFHYYDRIRFRILKTFARRWLLMRQTVLLNLLLKVKARMEIMMTTATLGEMEMEMTGEIETETMEERETEIEEAMGMEIPIRMTERFQELTMVCTKMVPEEEDLVEKFIGGISDNIHETETMEEMETEIEEAMGMEIPIRMTESTFSALLDVIPSTLDASYAIELADRSVAETNTVLRGCTLGLLGHPFSIDLMPVGLSSFEVIIGMD